MKDLLKQWENQTGIRIIKWNECELNDESDLWIEIDNGMITMSEIKMLNTLLNKNGYYYTFDNLDIFHGKITLWLN